MPNSHSPSVSIVIPTFGRWDALQLTLDALTQLDYPRNKWEAIVVDDGSPEDTGTLVEEWQTKTGAPVRFAKQQNAGPSAARNRGAWMATGEILIFIDNDILVKPDFVRQHVEALASHPNSWVIGRITHPPQLRQTPFGRYRDDLFEQFHQSHTGEGPYETVGISTQNLSLPSEDFRRLGGFDEGFTIASSEDWELGHRAKQTGVRIWYHPEIVVLHNDWVVSIEKFYERQRTYSFSDVLLWHKYGSASPRDHLVRENAPIDWKQDRPPLVAKKALKRVLATGVGTRFLFSLCHAAEKIAPDSRWNRRAYHAVAAAAICKGVRQGLVHYASAASPSPSGSSALPNT